MGFPGFAIGGSLGKSKEDMYRVIDWTLSELPADKPRHLLGIGTLEDIVEAVKRGVDLFDCAAPTEPSGTPSDRWTKHATAPLAGGIPAPSFIYLLRTGELSYFRLATVHNVRFMVRFMA